MATLGRNAIAEQTSRIVASYFRREARKITLFLSS
jgi:hypothetical protein